MKKLILTSILILLTSACFAQEQIALWPGGGSRSTIPSEVCAYDFCETFETDPGYDNANWSEDTSGCDTLNEDYEADALDGVQSLLLDSNDGGGCKDNNSDDVSDYTDAYMFFTMKIVAEPDAGSNWPMVRFLRSGGVVFALRLFDDTNNFWLEHGTVTTARGGSFSTATKYWCWLEYEAGSGADGVGRFYISTNGTKGAADITINNGDATQDAIGFQLYTYDQAIIIFDNVYWSDSPIGDQ